MDKQMEKQFGQFQDGFKSAFEAGQKMMQPVLHSSEVAMDSLNKLAEDQIQFSRSCLEINRKQVESLREADSITGMFPSTDAWSGFYKAATTYGEDLCKNAEETRDRMLKIGREAAETVASEANRTASKA
jgi:hypothetical protein